MPAADATLSPIPQALQRGHHPRADGAHSQARYCAQGHLPLDALNVEVTACGALDQPASADLYATRQARRTQWARDLAALQS